MGHVTVGWGNWAMQRGWWIGLAACAATAACAPNPNDYYGNVQSAYDGYAQPGYVQPGYIQPGYVPPAYAAPGYLAPDAGPGYVPQYGYPAVPVTPGYGYGGGGYGGYGYGRGREFRDQGFRDREFRRDFQDRGERERRFRDDQGASNRGRFEGNRVEQPRPPEPARQPPPPPGQTAPLPNGIFPGVPRPQPH